MRKKREELKKKQGEKSKLLLVANEKRERGMKGEVDQGEERKCRRQQEGDWERGWGRARGLEER